MRIDFPVLLLLRVGGKICSGACCGRTSSDRRPRQRLTDNASQHQPASSVCWRCRILSCISTEERIRNLHSTSYILTKQVERPFLKLYLHADDSAAQIAKATEDLQDVVVMFQVRYLLLFRHAKRYISCTHRSPLPLGRSNRDWIISKTWKYCANDLMRVGRMIRRC